jgi:hypothetical protein
MRGVIIAATLLLSTSANAQSIGRLADNWNSLDVSSLRNCRRPAEAKDAQVLAFDKSSLEAKLAVSVGDGDFKIVSVKLWDHQGDARPVIPVVEAARITQGKLQFYTPNLDADPDPVHDKQFLLVTTLGGAQLCWATESALLTQADSTSKALTAAAAADGKQRR